jgi:predicted metalloprotease
MNLILGCTTPPAFTLRPTDVEDGGAVTRGMFRFVAVSAAAGLMLGACASVVSGHPHVANAPNADLAVHGDSGGAFDTQVKNALSDVMDFWQTEFPKIANGKALPPLKGSLWSVDGAQVVRTNDAGAANQEACISRSVGFIVDNGAFCTLDDSIAWDRARSHLFAQLAQKYGPLVVALIFAHEFGHAISYRFGIFSQNVPTIYTESQADCAAGAWAAWALKGQAPHFRDITPEKVDAALEGFLDGRDATPGTPNDVSHGNGFDRLSALADGIDKGPSYCFSDGYFASRTFTERPFTSQKDYAAGGNTKLDQVLAPSADNFFVTDLNRFWGQAAKTINKTFTSVKIAEASKPPCATSSTIAFGYCPNDNTVYYNRSFASEAYNSLPGVNFDSTTGDVSLVSNQPGDFALGVLFAIGWGMAVRHQLFNRSLDDHDALVAAVCYTGAYAKDVNVDANTPGKALTLSPADLDEATSAMLNQVGRPQAFGNRSTTGLDRIQDFVRGYRDGLSGC